MSMRKKYSPAFKFKIALEALQGRSITDICRDHHLAPSLVHKWRDMLKKSGSQVFGDATTQGSADWQRERDRLYQHIGELSTQLGFLKKVLGE
jgi:transposase-like protein